MDGSTVGVVVGQEAHLGCSWALVHSGDIFHDHGAVELVGPEGQEHVINGRLEKFPGGGVIERRDLELLQERLGLDALASAPGGDHVHFLLHGELAHRCHGLGGLVRGVNGDHGDLRPLDAALDLVHIPEVVLCALGVVLAPG